MGLGSRIRIRNNGIHKRDFPCSVFGCRVWAQCRLRRRVCRLDLRPLAFVLLPGRVLPVAEFVDPWLGDKVNSGIGLSHRHATLIQKWTCCSGLGLGCQWSNYSWPGIQFPPVAFIKPVASPEFFRDFWVLIWCTFSQTGLFQNVPLPQPGILRESWKFVGCTSSQPGLFLNVPLLQPGMLREAL